MDGKRTRRNVFIMALALVALIFGMQLTMDASVAEAQNFKVEGFVESMPNVGLEGTWVVGGQQFVTSPNTEFDEVDGPLVVGACVDVEVFGGMVREIDSEPPQDCA